MASWLTELYLDQINRALLDEGAGQALPASDTVAASPTADDLGKQLQSFLATHLEARTRLCRDIRSQSRSYGGGHVWSCRPYTPKWLHYLCKDLLQTVCGCHVVQVLDPGLTATLLASYGRLDDLMHYATLRQACTPHRDARPRQASGSAKALTNPLTAP